MYIICNINVHKSKIGSVDFLQLVVSGHLGPCWLNRRSVTTKIWKNFDIHKNNIGISAMKTWNMQMLTEAILGILECWRKKHNIRIKPHPKHEYRSTGNRPFIFLEGYPLIPMDNSLDSYYYNHAKQYLLYILGIN